MNIRKNAVAGRFYPEKKEELEKFFNYFYEVEKQHLKATVYKYELIGGIVPHAGYIYSGRITYHFFDFLKNNENKLDTIVIIAPNHTGLGPDIASDLSEEWETPIGNIKVDKEFINDLEIEISSEAHKYEHSIEVVIPFIKYYINENVKIVPIIMKEQSYQNSLKLAKKILGAAKLSEKKILVIASSDFSHYVDADYGKKLDEIAIKKIIDKDAIAFFKCVCDDQISICGYGPIAVLIEYSKMVSNCAEFTVLKSGSSGEISGGEEVVDYVSMAVFKKD